jgi:hypothetical protein
MTRKAGNGDVQTHERECRKVVIELQMTAPGFHAVALRAVGPQFASMHVIRTVASSALHAEFLAGDDCGVAGMAVQLLVRSAQFELAIACVVETRRCPGTCGMALLAACTEA